MENQLDRIENKMDRIIQLLENKNNAVTPEKQEIYVDGKLIARANGYRVTKAATFEENRYRDIKAATFGVGK